MYCRVRPRNSAQVALDLRRGKGDPIDHGVEGRAFQGARRRRGVVDIGVEGVHARGQIGGVPAARQEREIDAALRRPGACTPC